MCCDDNSMFASNASKRVIKFACTPTGPSLNITDGASIINKTSMCDISNLYDEYITVSYYLKGNTTPQQLPVITTITDPTFVLITTTYINNSIQYPVPLPQYLGYNETPYTSYILGDDPTIHYIDNIMILSGTPTKPIDQITITNENANFDISLNIIIAKKNA